LGSKGWDFELPAKTALLKNKKIRLLMGSVSRKKPINKRTLALKTELISDNKILNTFRSSATSFNQSGG